MLTYARPLEWSPPAKSCEACPYDHTRAETAFGSFLLTWKSWKSGPGQDPGYGFDETPWGEAEYHGFDSVEDAQEWAAVELDRRLRLVLLDPIPEAIQLRAEIVRLEGELFRLHRMNDVYLGMMREQAALAKQPMAMPPT